MSFPMYSSKSKEKNNNNKLKRMFFVGTFVQTKVGRRPRQVLEKNKKKKKRKKRKMMKKNKKNKKKKKDEQEGKRWKGGRTVEQKQSKLALKS